MNIWSLRCAHLSLLISIACYQGKKWIIIGNEFSVFRHVIFSISCVVIATIDFIWPDSATQQPKRKECPVFCIMLFEAISLNCTVIRGDA